jgi:uncharacterized protein YndB with AHSA1/START domain
MTKREEPTVTLERSFKAPVEKVWTMWTTTSGLEKWYWPEGLTAKVLKLEVKPGGSYEIAAPGLPHTSRGTYEEVIPNERLVLLAKIDFIEGVDAFERRDVIEFHRTKEGTRMVFTSTKLPGEWQERSIKGFWSSLDKLERALAKEQAS